MLDLSFGLYSGYVPIKNNNYHYVAALSKSDPFNDPVIFWLNGGPGCSSMVGFLKENGPYMISDELGRKFIKNEFSRNNEATVIYLESPAGVGFSLCGSGQCTFDDNNTAENNMKFIIYLLE